MLDLLAMFVAIIGMMFETIRQWQKALRSWTPFPGTELWLRMPIIHSVLRQYKRHLVFYFCRLHTLADLHNIQIYDIIREHAQRMRNKNET